MSSTSLAVLFSALPHCWIVSRSTARRKCWDILKCRRTFFKKKNGPKFSIDTLNNNVDNAKSLSFQWKRLQFAAKKNLQVTKGFKFEKNKNVRFISGNFSSDRFREKWKQYEILTVSVFRIYYIETHVTSICHKNSKFLTWVQDQNLLFTFHGNDYEAKFWQIAFSESVSISHGQHLPLKFFSISAFTLCAPSDHVMRYLGLFMQT